jgi:thymidylate synthase (FAD)
VKVTLVAKTEFLPPAHIPWEPHEGDSDLEALSEMSGRLCYVSWNRPNPKTATNAGYIGNIIAHEHFSVMEHGSASFLVEGVSRYLTTELIRHRHGQWSQLSTRYCDATEPVRHPSMNDAEWEDYQTYFAAALEEYQEKYHHMRARGLSKKEAREAARFYLPGGIETKIVMTANMRAYRDILKKRWSIHADKEIQQLAGMLLTELRRIAPHSFSDIPDTPYE